MIAQNIADRIVAPIQELRDLTIKLNEKKEILKPDDVDSKIPPDSANSYEMKLLVRAFKDMLIVLVASNEQLLNGDNDGATDSL